MAFYCLGVSLKTDYMRAYVRTTLKATTLLAAGEKKVNLWDVFVHLKHDLKGLGMTRHTEELTVPGRN